MTHVGNCTVDILSPAYAIYFRNMWLKALRNHPDAYYETYGEAYKLRDNFSFWEERCTEIENVQCAFGAFERRNLAGIVRIIRGEEDPIYDGQAVLSGGYYEGEDPMGAAKLLEAAKIWTAEHTHYDEIMAAAVITNTSSRRSLESAGFYEVEPQTLTWPATGLKVQQMWHGFHLDDLRPKPATREVPEPPLGGLDSLK